MQVDLELLLKLHPEFSRSLLTFAALHVTSAAWPENSLMAEYNSCSTDCSPGQRDPCSCTCYADPFDWSDDEVRTLSRSIKLVASDEVLLGYA